MCKQFYNWIVLVTLLATGLAACNSEAPRPAAPIGDHAVLEQLADAYREVAQQYPVQPRGMRPEARKQFVQQIFAQTGYDYAATLQALAAQNTDVASQDQRDLTELLFLPHQGLADTDLATLYSDTELAAVRTIQNGLH
jgi:hypothetical protein